MIHRSNPQPTKNDARARAARSFFVSAGLAIDDADAVRWTIVAAAAPGAPARAYSFFPQSGHFRRPDGSTGAGGARALIAEIRGGDAKPAG